MLKVSSRPVSASERRRSLAVFGTIAILLMQTVVYAQMTGTITGTVYDSSGAAVPGAKVILKNQGSQAETAITSNDAGYFTFAAIMPGTYNVKVEVQGFKSWEKLGIVMNSGDKRHISDIKLEAGNITEQVTVTATGGEITPVDSGERSAVLSGKQISNLSLQGRDVTELIKILPGFHVKGGLKNGEGFDPSVTGMQGSGSALDGLRSGGGSSMDLTTDGADILDRGCNCSGTQTVNGDMVEEVKVSTSNFGADSARGPVVISATTKSGKSEYHGAGYLHVRDSTFNSMDAWLKYLGGTKPDDRYMYPGFNFGGPVRLPWTRFNEGKKLLFWAGYENYYQRLPSGDPLLANVPTVAMRNGDFTNDGEGNRGICPGGFGGDPWGNWGRPVCNPIAGFTNLPNGKPLTENIIPADAIDPSSAAIMKLFPMPNADPAKIGVNYMSQFVNKQNGQIAKARVDYNFSNNTKLYASYQYQNQTREVPVQLWWRAEPAAPYPGGMVAQDNSQSISVNFVHIFSASLTNELVGTYAYTNLPLAPGKPEMLDRSILGYPYKGIYNNGSRFMPSVVNAWWSSSLGYPHVYQADMWEPDGHLILKKVMPTFQDNLTWTRGTHTLKFGGYYEMATNDQGDQGYMNGQVSYGVGGPFKNDAYHPEGIGSFNPVANILLGVVSGYLELNHNGIVFDKYTTYGGYAQDEWKVKKNLTLQLGLRLDHLGPWGDTRNAGMPVWKPEKYEADVAAGKDLPGIYWHGIDPSVPLTGVPVRAIYLQPRFGMSWDVFGKGDTVIRGGWGVYRYNDSWNDTGSLLFTSNGVRQYNIPHAMYLKDIDLLSGSSNAGKLSSSASALDSADDQKPQQYSYNLTISQRLPGKSMLEISYVGNTTNYNPRKYNINRIPIGALFNPDPVTGAAPNPKDANLDHYTPYSAGYGHGEISINRHDAKSDYNALQVSWNKQSGNFVWTMNYTWSKQMGLRSTNLLIPLSDRYGVTGDDRSHVFNASYMYEMGNWFKGNFLLKGILNGWKVSGITTVQSGPNLQSLMSGDAISNFGMSGAIGSGDTSVSADGRQWLGTSDLDLQPALVRDPTFNTANTWIMNGNSFTVPAFGSQGTYIMPYTHGPYFFKSDLSVRKVFSITEKQNVEFMFSAFNFLNHALVSFKDSGDDTLKLKFKTLDNGESWVLDNPLFGFARAKVGRRVCEFSIKYSF